MITRLRVSGKFSPFSFPFIPLILFKKLFRFINK